MIRPNLFIIGAPKCGTSSLFDWLLMHPDIVGTKTKEPFFLIDPAHPLAKERNASTEGLEGYKDLFTPQARNASICMEATTHYLFDPIARSIIKDMPDARVLIVLREPAARVHSSFNYTVNNLARLDPSLTFSQYLRLVEQGESLMPDWCSHAGSAYVLERDIQYSRYHHYVSQWLESIGHEHTKILLMEEMVCNPSRTVSELFAWLKLDATPVELVGGTARNRTVSVRLARLHALSHRINRGLSLPLPAQKAFKQLYGVLQYGAFKTTAADDMIALNKLRDSFAEDNARLSALIGRDLAAWHHGSMKQ